jgi:hypothetical protein
VLLIVLAPIVFVLSGLFLFNVLVYPSGSVPYIIGELLCLLVSPFLLILGISVYFVAWKRHQRTRPQVQPKEETATVEPPMPGWERWARWTYALILFGLLVLVVLSSLDVIGIAMGVTFVVPIVVVCLYLRSSWRSWFGAVLLLILSLFVFFVNVPSLVPGWQGTPGVGVVNAYLDWAAGITSLGGLLASLVFRAGVLQSASIFLVIAKFMQHQKLRRFTESRIVMTIAVVAILLPFWLILALPTANITTTPNSPIMYPSGIAWGGPSYLLPDLGRSNFASPTFRTFNSTTGLWTYTIAMSNQGATAVTITHVWAGREVVAPFETRITVNESGVSVTEAGIVFAPLTSGTIRFSTGVGYNVITLGIATDSRDQFSWP